MLYLVVCSPITSNHLIQRIASAQVFRGSPATSKAGQRTSVNLSVLSPPRMATAAQLAAQESAILHKSSSHVSGGSSSRADKAVAKKIVYYKGMHLPTAPMLNHFNFNSRSLCGGYKCTVEYIYDETLTENADMVVFKHMLERTPPKKQKNQLWTFQTVESQTSTRYCDTKAWEGLFNYSISPIRSSVSNQHDVCMSTRPVRRDHVEDYEIVAPPQSYIDVRNFTSTKHLAEHLKYVTENEHAFNYYQRWRNEYLIPKYDQPIGN